MKFDDYISTVQTYTVEIKRKDEGYTIIRVELNGEIVGEVSVSPKGFSLKTLQIKNGWRGSK